jgi:hypothetical protein
MNQTPGIRILNQIISKMILEPKSYGILKEFFEALDKYEIEYEVPEYRNMIKIKGHIIGAIFGNFSTIYFEQNKGKRINISYEPDYIEISIFTRNKPIPIRIKIPKWKIEYDKPYLYIFFN